MTANFSSTVNADFTRLIITDASTANYDGAVINSRKLVFESSAGVSTEFVFPIVNGVGDSFMYTIEGDVALNVSLILTPAVTNPLSKYTKSTNLLLANNLIKGINDLRKEIFLLKFDPSDCGSTKSEINTLEIADGFFETAKSLISSDLVGADRALKLGNSFITSNNCSC